MKNNFIITILFVFSILNCTAQSVLSVEDLVGVEPIWSYISQDPNFMDLDENNPHVNSYTRQKYQDHIVQDKTIYLLERLSHYGGMPRDEGYFLHAIDIDTGVPDWVRYNNYFGGNSFVESARFGQLRMRPDGNIIMHGFKSLDSILLDCNGCFVHGNPLNHHIDVDNGYLIREDFDSTDTVKNDYKLLGFHSLASVADDEFLKYLIINKVQDGTLHNILEFYHVDEFAQVSDSTIFKFEYDTNIPNGLTSFSYSNNYLQVNENLGVALFGTIDPAQARRPVEILLKYFDTSNPYDIMEINEVDVLSTIVPDQIDGSDPVRLLVYENEIVLTQYTKVRLENDVVDFSFWLSRYDHEGNEISRIERFQKDGVDYGALSELSAFEGDIYFTGKISSEIDGEPDILDFYKWSEDGNVTLLNSIEIDSDNGVLSTSSRILDINEDNEISMSISTAYYNQNDEFQTVQYIAKFHGSDFGLSTSTNNIAEDEVYLYPNPTHDMINISEPVKYYKITSVVGQQLMAYSEDKYSSQIDIKSLGEGLYYLHTEMKNGEKIVLPFVKSN